ncbi:MAG: TonB-dependent receptor, partial [Pseudomonadales bacterium]|nr:TonB-dependent receptor [Pseudomonadales bacterium]
MPCRTSRTFTASVLGALLLNLPALALAAPIEEVVVTGDLRESALSRLAAPVTVIDETLIRERSATHLEDVLITAPNVNIATGSSRARFIQIRGIGERGQFAEPLNPSVGVIVDDVDLSGAATAATLFDVAQVEVFRGPQAGRYGANALAGLVVLRTAAPTELPEGRVELDAGAFDTRRIGAVLSGPLAGPTLTGRLAAQQNRSDGWMRNAFLDRDDTAGRDERSLRGRLRWAPTDRFSTDLTLARVDIENGYDGFTLDNSFTTLSDAPGRDAQDSRLASLHARLETDRGIDVDLIAAGSDSRIDYGYDEDWTFVGFDPDGYSSTDRYQRDRRTSSLELRIGSERTARRTDWLVGIFDLNRDVDLERDYSFAPGPFASRLRTQRTALFGSLGHALTESLRMTGSLRVERRDDRYDDSEEVAFTPRETLLGGRAALEWTLDSGALLYGSLSRGYKAGGFNTDGSLDADLREFASEAVWNYELGVKSLHLDGTLATRAAAFVMTRADQQVATSIVRLRGDGSAEFIDFV